MSMDIMFAFRKIVFTNTGSICYVNDIMCPATRNAFKSLADVIDDPIWNVDGVPDGWVHLIQGRARDGVKRSWVSMDMLVHMSEMEGWYRREPPHGQVEGIDGAWDGNGEWMNFKDASEELPAEI